MKEKKNLFGGNFNGLLIGSCIVLFFGGILLFKQNELLKNQVAFQEKTMIQQTNLAESVRKSGFGALVGNILNKVDQELNQSSTNKLSNETIARIAAVAYSLKPYQYFVGDSLSSKSFSPERGQLLLALSKMGIDSTSFSKIIFKTSFAGADLRGADLRNANLNGIDLKGANLKEADLRNVNLKKADLKGIYCWGANLNKAKLNRADLKRADLSWAELNEVDLRKANLNGADLSDAKLRNADLRGATLKWATLIGTALNDVNFATGTLFWADLRRANLSCTNLAGVDLRRVNLSEANLQDANLTGAKLALIEVADKNWFEKLIKSRVIGAKKIQKKYQLVKFQSEDSDYKLEERKDLK